MKDEEIARSLRHGVGYDGRNFLDFMPFHNTSDEDLTAIISYLRASQPVKNEVPPTEYTILGKVLMSFAIEPVGPTGDVARSVKRDSTAEYGKYMAFSVANCYGCHTERDLKTGDFIGQPFAGGLELDMGGEYLFYSPNITNDKKTGRLHGWTEEQFISRFREGKKIPGSPMPWGPFSRMDEVDLKAIYRYMQTVEPVEREHKNLIVKKS
jgi:mono/diheme cytochrome c family protein